MKIEKRTIWIIAVIAVALVLIAMYRKKKAVADPTETSDSDKTLDYILTHIDFNQKEREKIEAMRQACEKFTTTRQQVEAKAYNNGLSFDQQLVCEALWSLYATDNGWSSDRGWQLIAKVKEI